MTVHEIYEGSDGEATKALYMRLQSLGAEGVIAMNLFRANKCSNRAKEYSRRFKGEAYGRKQWSLENLCKALNDSALRVPASVFKWGWKEDPNQPVHKWVLYVEIPTGQVSFHSEHRGIGPDYPGEWDGQLGAGAGRICNWCAQLLGEPQKKYPLSPGKYVNRCDVLVGAPVATQEQLF